MTNYRPISLTSIICKQMEVLKDNLMENIAGNEILTDYQHGFASLGDRVLPNYFSVWIIGQTCWTKATVWTQYISTSQKRLIVYGMRDCWRKLKATGYGKTSYE